MAVQTQSVGESVPAAVQLSFRAYAVTIDNFTNSWAWVPAAGRYVRPLSTMVLSLDGTTSGEIKWQSPPLSNAVTPQGAKGTLYAYWNDQSLPPTQPTPLYSGQTQSQFLGQFGAAGSGSTTKAVTVPAGTETLLISVEDNLASVSVNAGAGPVGAFKYFVGGASSTGVNATSLGEIHTWAVPISTDASTTVSITVQGSTSSVFEVVAVPYPVTPQQMQVFGQVETWQANSTLTGNISVAQLNDVGNGGTAIAAVSNKIVTVYGYALTWRPTATTVQTYSAHINASTTTTSILVACGMFNGATTNTSLATTSLWLPPGVGFPTGEGLKVTADTVGLTVNGVIYYTQA